MKKRIIACALAAALLVGAGTQAAQAAPRIISAVASSALGGPQQLSVGAFQSEIKTRMGERLVVDGRSGTTLGSENALLAAARSGSVDIAILTGPVVSIAVPEFGVFDMPFVFRDWAHVKAVSEGPLAEQIAPKFAAKGLVLLAIGEQGFRNITNSKRPIRTPADLAGIKLRVPGGKWRVKMFQAYGANPSPMKFSEVFTALQTGVMDGEENPFTQIYSAKFQEVQKYLSLTGHVYTPAYLTVGRTKWESIPADVRKVLEDTAKETQAYVYEVAARDDDDLLGKLKAAGMQVNEADKDAFIAASKPIYEEFGKEVAGAKDVIDRAVALGK